MALPTNNLSQNVQLAQDLELSQALTELSQNPQAMQNFLTSSRESLYNDVTGHKNDMITKVYGDYKNASQANDAMLSYYLRNNELKVAQDDLYNYKKYDTDAAIGDKDISKRQYEINQWAVGDKMDTLFIYQQLFIILCTVAILTFLRSRGLLSPAVHYGLIVALTLIFLVTLVYRARYTAISRDQRYWNRRAFPVDGPAIAHDSKCHSPSVNDMYTGAMPGMSDMYLSAKDGISNAISGVESGISGTYSAVKSNVSDVVTGTENGISNMF